MVSNEKGILLRPTSRVPVPTCPRLEANESKAFAISRSGIGVGRIVFLDFARNGKFFDRRNVESARSEGRSSGCFCLKSSRSTDSIAFTSNIRARTKRFPILVS